MFDAIGLSQRFGIRLAATVLFSMVSGNALAWALTLSGTPAPSVTVGQNYSFQPAARSSAGKALTFSITNRPAWALFDRYSGRLSGAPQSTQLGTYSNIVIRATDGRKTVGLPAFSITVQAVVAAAPEPTPTPAPEPTPEPTPEPAPAPAPVLGAATINWMPPMQNTDGSTLTNLVGYKVSYGLTRGGPYTSSVNLSNASLSTYVVENLSAGTYYFVVAARNSNGVESALSNEAVKTIN